MREQPVSLPPLSGMIAVDIADLAPALLDWFELLNPRSDDTAEQSPFVRDLLSQSPPCSAEEWLWLYRDHRRVLSETLDAVFGSGSLFSHVLPVILKSFSQRHVVHEAGYTVTPDVKREVRNLLDSLFAQGAELTFDEDAIPTSETSERSHESMMEAWNTIPEVQFFFRIWGSLPLRQDRVSGGVSAQGSAARDPKRRECAQVSSVPRQDGHA